MREREKEKKREKERMCPLYNNRMCVCVLYYVNFYTLDLYKNTYNWL